MSNSRIVIVQLKSFGIKSPSYVKFKVSVADHSCISLLALCLIYYCNFIKLCFVLFYCMQGLCLDPCTFLWDLITIFNSNIYLQRLKNLRLVCLLYFRLKLISDKGLF